MDTEVVTVEQAHGALSLLLWIMERNGCLDPSIAVIARRSLQVLVEAANPLSEESDHG